MPAKPSLSYRDAGVDIDAGNRLVDRIGPAVARTRRPEVLGGLGGFGGLFALDTARFPDPVLVSGTDGVGTKLKIAQATGKHDTIGIDLVAMCVNDVLVQGAEPLFFLDYFACGRLEEDTAASVVAGVAQGCETAGCALLGGETAEMPDLYAVGEYDLAGFCVGAASRSQLLDGSAVRAGDVLIGAASTGVHSNGFSLIRQVVSTAGAELSDRFGDSTLGDTLLTPTALYVKPVLEMLEQCEIHALAHITGGGLAENTLRVIPEALGVSIDFGAWQRPEIFQWIADSGPVDEPEMRRVFNLGVGFVIVAPPEAVTTASRILDEHGIDHRQIGTVHKAGDRARLMT